MIRINTDESMFPPETTHTILWLFVPPVRAAATDVAPAPSATIRFLSMRSFTAAAVSRRVTVIEPWRRDLARLYISGRTLFTPALSTKLGTRWISWAEPLAKDAAKGAAVSGSQA